MKYKNIQKYSTVIEVIIVVTLVGGDISLKVGMWEIVYILNLTVVT